MARLLQSRVGYRRKCKRGQLEALGVKTGVATLQRKNTGRKVLKRTINVVALKKMRAQLDSDRARVLDELIFDIEKNPLVPVEDIFLGLGKKLKERGAKYPGAATKLYSLALKLKAIRVGE